MQIATATNSYSGILVSQGAISNAGVPLIARVYLTLATWKRALSPGLDDDAIQGPKNGSFFTHCLPFLLFPTIINFFHQKYWFPTKMPR
jgi:hypothetical protein